MAYLLASIPYFRCYVRREYTTAHKRGNGEFLSAIAFAVHCRRGRMLDFQVVFTGEDGAGNPVQTGGAMFAMVPIIAICDKPTPQTASINDVAPWDVFSETFTVVELDMLTRMRMVNLPSRLPGRYLFSIDFCASDIADDPEQHKQLHICKMDAGNFGAFPNNRMLLIDPAQWVTLTERPDFESDGREYFAE
jgi:hypothetical protein